MRSKLLICYLFTIHAILGLCIYKSDLVRVKLLELGFHSTKLEYSKHYHSMTSYHKSISQNLPKDSIIYIGDSHIQGLAVPYLHYPTFNFGIGGDTTFGVLNRITKYASLDQTLLIIISIGINDIKLRNNNEIISNLEKIFQVLQANTVVITSILPINTMDDNHHSGYNIRINQLNKEISTLANNSKNVRYIDTYSNLVDINGQLTNTLHTGDGLHLNKTGKQVLINTLDKELKEIFSVY